MKGQALILTFSLCILISSTVGSHDRFHNSFPWSNVFHMSQKKSMNIVSIDEQCSISDGSAKFDCYPDAVLGKTDPAVCKARGCCWLPVHASKVGMSVPWCYYPKNYDGYIINDLKETSTGFTASLIRTSASGWPNDITHLTLDILMETQSRLHFKIYDSTNKRYEVPLDTPKVTSKSVTTDYSVNFTAKPFGLSIKRKSTGAILFDTTLLTGPLIFADQFLQISTHTGTGLVYGLGEHKIRLLHKSDWSKLSMWARDQGPKFDSNLYGSHPFYMNLENDGQAHGVFLLNSNAMEIDLQPLPALTFRTIGGILDFYVFTGPSADDVIQQYTDVIGKPFMPPYWSLGFHLCRYGYGSSERLKEIIDRNRKIKIPYEVQWTDIDYMDSYKDWTYDHDKYSDLPEIIKDLHDQGQRYIIIVDPAISNSHPGEYAPYDQGITQDVFIRNASGGLLVGAVWPGNTVFPDFFHPNTSGWWYEQASNFHQTVEFDGLWIDMNEPSNFVTGSQEGCTNGSFDKPPYLPGIADNSLPVKTLCPSAQQYLSSHYNLHNMYGYSEMVATYSAVSKILMKRSIVISRSTFPGSGHHGGHWTGDISSTWEDLYYSIPAILTFQMYGIPFVGADICGFTKTCSEELCIRWMQLGSFYPFMRNHNTKFQRDQDPGAFSHRAQKIMKSALEIRYSLLPYLYTLMHRSHHAGWSVARPLFFEFPTDVATHDIDSQFMWGNSLLISPALNKGQTQVQAYFPSATWYDLYEGVQIVSQGKYITLDAPLEKINVHVRGGSIIALQMPAVNTKISRTLPFALLVALNETKGAFGSLFWDDGETIGTHEQGLYTAIQFAACESVVESTVQHKGFTPSTGMKLSMAKIMGVKSNPKQVTVNDKVTDFKYHHDHKELLIEDFTADLLESLTIKWQ